MSFTTAKCRENKRDRSSGLTSHLVTKVICKLNLKKLNGTSGNHIPFLKIVYARGRSRGLMMYPEACLGFQFYKIDKKNNTNLLCLLFKKNHYFMHKACIPCHWPYH